MNGTQGRVIRAGLLFWDESDKLCRIDDGLMVVSDGRIVAVGAFDQTRPLFPDLTVRDLRPLVLAPGFIDSHIHYPQTDVIGSPAEGLLPWLNHYTFPHEARFADPAYARGVAEFFLDELLGQGVTTAFTYCSSHPSSVDALFEAAAARNLRWIAGKCLMDRNAPEPVRDETVQSLLDSERLIQRWHNHGRLGYALTPRFVPSCSDEQLQGTAELAAQHPGVWVQTHVAENADEIAWVRSLHPKARSYLDVYDQFGLVRPRSVYAHCIHVDDADRSLLREQGAAASVCPTSNLFLGSGLFDFESAERSGIDWALASDVGGGTSFSPFHTMLAAYQVARLRGVTLNPQTLWFRHTLGAARALRLQAQVGNLTTGLEADAILLDPQATPLLARRTAMADSLDEWLFALIVLGDDRAIAGTLIAGEPRLKSDASKRAFATS